MDLHAFAWSAALSLLPISELRGGIPYAYFSGGMPLWLAALWCLAWNASVAVLGFVLLNTVHKLLSRFAWYARIFEALLGRARRKLHAGVEKYGYWGIFFFVAIPLPFTGAWTGVLGAWALGMETGKAMRFVALGVACACAIVTGAILIGDSFLVPLFLKLPA
jgi:uncharacterized membrane protein